MSQVQRNVGWVGKRPFDIHLAPLKSVLRIRREINSPIKSERILSLTNDRGVIPYEEKGAIGNNVSEDISRYSIVHIGDIVMNSMNVIIGSVGLSKYDGALSPVYYVLQPVNKDQMDMRYFAYHFGMPAFYRQLARIGYGILEHRMRIPWINLQNELMFVPPIAKQKAIADYLDRETARIDALIEKKYRQVKLLEERFNAEGLNIISGASTDFENLSNKSDSVNGSSKWLPLKLAWCLKTGSGTTPTSGAANYYSEDGIPWVTTAELREDVILKTSMGVTNEARRNFSALKVFPPGTVLVAMYGATVGRAAVLGIEACVNQACCAVYGQGRINLDFFYWWARLHRQDLIDLGYGSGQPNISQDTIRSLRIKTPNIEQQEAIVRHLANSWARTEALLSMTKQHIQLLVERKQSMITAAVSGDLVIPEVAA